jgi:TPR repeat protein
MKRFVFFVFIVAAICGVASAQSSLVQQGKTQLKNKQYAAAIGTFKKAASGGNAEAMYYVGQCYEKGQGVQQDIYEAMEWYFKAADKGDGKACARLSQAYSDNCTMSLFYEADCERRAETYAERSALAECSDGEELYAWLRMSGFVVKTDLAEALRFFRQSADRGNVDAMCDLAQIYFHGLYGAGVDKSKSRQYLEKLRGVKSARSYNQQAYMYLDGSAGTMSEKEAYNLFLKAANMGDAQSEAEIGRMYMHTRKRGDGNIVQVLPKSEVQGINWLKKACGHGYTPAGSELGSYYEKSKRYSEALKWYYKAGDVNSFKDLVKNHRSELAQSDVVAKLTNMAKRGVLEAQKMLGEAYDKGQGVQKSAVSAFKWYYAAATNRHADTYDFGDLFNRLGNMYFRGEGTTQSHSEAFKWYSRGATCTHESGWPLHNMGDCYAGGFGVAKNEYEAFNCYKKSAGTNNISAMNRVATCCLLGRGTSKNGSEAFKWAKKSADYGDMEGQYVLAICYYLGEGTQRNVGLAREYMSKSANQGFAQAKADLSKISSQQTAYNTNPNDIYKQGMEMINNMYKQASNVSTETLIKWGEAAQRQGGTYNNSNTYNNSSSSSSSPTRVTCPRCNGKRYHPESYTDCADIYSYNNQAGTTCYICGQVTKHCHYPCLTCQSRGTVEKY